MRSGEYFTNIGKYPSIGGDIGMRRFSDRGLIDDDGLIDVLESFDTSMLPDGMGRSIEVVL